MSKTAFILTSYCTIYEHYKMPIMIAMRETKEDAQALHRTFLTQGKATNIRAVKLDNFTIEISAANAHTPIILGKLCKDLAQAEKAAKKFAVLYPTAFIRVIQFKQCKGINLGGNNG